MNLRSMVAPQVRVVLSCALLSACASGPPHPSGWTAGTNGAWTQGDQKYVVASQPFSGTLKDLASQETINVVLQTRGARFVKSDPYPDCPGLGGLMTYDVAGGTRSILLVAFSVRNSTAMTVSYTRPASAKADPAAMSAMKEVTCKTVI